MKNKILNVLTYIVGGIIGLALIAVGIFGVVFIMSSGTFILENYPYQSLTALLAAILLFIIIRHSVITYRIKRAIEHGIINNTTGTIYMIEEKNYKVGSYNIDMPWLEDSKYYFYNEYNMIPEEKREGEAQCRDIRINRKNAIVVSREHLNAILKKKNFSLYKGNRQFDIILTVC